MNLIETATAYLERDRVLHINMLEVLRRGSVEELTASSKGVLLYERGCGAWMMSAQPGEAERLLDLVPGDCDLFVGHDMAYFHRIQERWGLSGQQICYSAAYLKKEPVPIPDFDGELRLLGPEWARWVYEHYSHPFGGVAYIEGAIRRGMLGLFLKGSTEPAGFVGFHEEGSIGMLEVLPAYRRRGLGEILQRAAVNLALERGAYPFGQVFDDNSASLSLQQKVGMTLSRTKMFWLMKDDENGTA